MAARIAQDALARMTLEQRVGQVFMLGFDGTTLTEANRALIGGLHLGGVTLFGRNIESGQQLARLDSDLQTIADPVPLFISIDQEGGLVVRVTSGATIFPGNMALGATGDAGLARRVARAEALELRAMGVNMQLAPVIDVNTNPQNPVIGTRAFGSTADLVSEMGAQSIRGFQSIGVSAVGKHFPGHGDTDVDSHRDLPVVRHGRERLMEVELRPFAAAIAAGVDGIMTAHVHVPSIEAAADRPATLSQAVLTGLLRDQLGFRGLILTDALDMAAIADRRSPAEAAVEAFEAGADMLLIAGIASDDRRQVADGPRRLLEVVRAGRITEARLNASVRRILETKALRGVLGGVAAAPRLDVLESPRHRALALEAARRAVTLHRDARRLLPLRAADRVVVVVADEPTRSQVRDDAGTPGLLEAVQRFAPAAVGLSTREVVTGSQCTAGSGELRGDEVTMGLSGADAESRLRGAGVFVFGTYDLAQHDEQRALADRLVDSGKRVIGVGLRGPYDAAAAPRIGTFLTVYGDRPVHLRAAAEALFRRPSPSGRMP